MAIWITLSCLLLTASLATAGFNFTFGPIDLNNTLTSDIPNYHRHHPTKVNRMVEAHGVCGSSYGKFAAVSFKKSKQHMCVFDFHGHLLKDIRLPYPGKMSDCAFVSPSLMFLCDYSGEKIYKMTTDGQYRGVLVSGIRCIRMLYVERYLFVTVDSPQKVVVYDRNGNFLYHFNPGCPARGLAFDMDFNLHLSCGRIIKKVTYDGKYISQKSYPHVRNSDGIAIDAKNNIIITCRNPSSTVVVYSPEGRLIHKYHHFASAADAAIVYQGNQRPTLALADNGRGTSGNIKVYTG